jgi:hypothetical protein
MNIQDAIKQAGEGGKYKRESWEHKDYLKSIDGIAYVNETGVEARILLKDLIADDWEVVQPEFEFGDEVTRNSMDKCLKCECKVLHEDTRGALTLRIWNGPENNCACVCDVLSSIALIRKAPKKHVFEGD